MVNMNRAVGVHEEPTPNLYVELCECAALLYEPKIDLSYEYQVQVSFSLVSIV